ncbi:ankyrin repeat domain-containing protein [Butyrivibrio sp. VCB2001]|uniref:ankyrin repeat domain-containing protein n=1 Tax=Butyrivibrio sp. VCB2001 TaxID=1280667 RepID=UPI00041A3B6F|nr:ankyrin repeat domain-containing protein [Butyrivibrio sp. VCB2001]
MDKEIVKEMRAAIKAADLDHIREMIDKHAGILDEVTIFGTFLADAASTGPIESVRFLVEAGADINKIGGYHESGPLTVAAFDGRLDVVRYLFEHGAILDVSSFSTNPLFGAIYNGHTEVAKFLVENGIDLTATYPIANIDECDAYEYARMYGKTEIAEYLKDIMGKLDMVKEPDPDEEESPYADGVEPIFPYDSFEKDLYDEVCKCLRNHGDNKDIYAVSISYWPEFTTFIGVALNTNSNLKSMPSKDESEYMYYKYCEEEWAIGEEFKGLSKELVDYYNALKQWTSDDDDLWEKTYDDHVKGIIEICKRVLLKVKQSPEYALYPSLNLNVYVREFFSEEEEIAIFKELNTEQAVHEYERFLYG